MQVCICLNTLIKNEGMYTKKTPKTKKTVTTGPDLGDGVCFLCIYSGFHTYKTQKRIFKFLYVQNSKNEKGGLYTYKTPKSKMKVSTRRKHPKRKFMFLYLDLTENENGGFYTYKTPKTEMMVSTRINAQNENAGLYMFKHSNQKWRYVYKENSQKRIFKFL